MQLDWIEDLLAVIDTGSLTRAAEKRLLTQSAFTRRVRSIEERIGASLFDRTSKPVSVRPAVRALEPELRALSLRLRQVQTALRAAADSGARDVTFACQHAITTTISPWIVKQLTRAEDVSVKVKSGDLDNCLVLLLSGEADFAITYEHAGDGGPELPRAFEVAQLGSDLLVPVGSPALLDGLAPNVLPVITYPPDVFLGRVFGRAIYPALPEDMALLSRAETSLTLAACAYALDDIAVAWLPLALVRDHLADGRLVLLDHLPQPPLGIKLIRLSDQQDRRMVGIWESLIAAAGV